MATHQIQGVAKGATPAAQATVTATDADHAGVDVNLLSTVTPAATEAHLGQVGGTTVTVISSKARPANTETYTAGDVLNESITTGTAFTFANCARVNSGGGFITGALLIDGANQTLKGNFELWLFHTAPAADYDNAVFTPTDAELQALVAIVPFSTTGYVGDATAGVGGNCVHRPDSANWAPVPFVCAAASRALYGVLVLRNAYVPVSAGTVDIILRIDQN